MKITSRVKKFLIVTGIIYCLAAVLIFVWPAAAAASLAMLLGFGILCSGVLLVLSTFAESENLKSPSWTLACGILDIMVGIILLLHPLTAVIAVSVLIGLWALFASSAKISASLSFKSLGIKNWWVPLLTGIFGVIAAFLIILLPGAGAFLISLFMGIYFLMAGITSIIEGFMLSDKN